MSTKILWTFNTNGQCTGVRKTTYVIRHKHVYDNLFEPKTLEPPSKNSKVVNLL